MPKPFLLPPSNIQPDKSVGDVSLIEDYKRAMGLPSESYDEQKERFNRFNGIKE